MAISVYTELDQNYQASMQVIYSNESLFLLCAFLRNTSNRGWIPRLEVRALVGRVNSQRPVSVPLTMQPSQPVVQVQTTGLYILLRR